MSNEIAKRLQTELAKTVSEYRIIEARYSGGDSYSSDDSSMEDYLDGKIAGLEYAIYLVERENNG